MVNRIIDEIKETVAQREAVYGPPTKDFDRIAKMWSAVLEIEVTREQYAMCMMLVKISRLSQTPDHRDSLLDVVGYAHCMESCLMDAKK